VVFTHKTMLVIELDFRLYIIEQRITDGRVNPQRPPVVFPVLTEGKASERLEVQDPSFKKALGEDKPRVIAPETIARA